MADVANCMNSTTPTKTHMGQITPDSTDSVVLSPGVKEAMDRIFPRSATQLLQGGLSFGEDSLFGVASLRASKESSQARNPLAATSCVDNAALHNKPSHISTLANSDTAMSSSLGFISSASRNGSAFVNSSPAFATSSHSHTPSDLSFDNNKDYFDSAGKSQEIPKHVQSKIRISKADFEIVTSCEALINEYERASRRLNCVDASSSECHSRDESDSEDMRRPFATIAREKKRRKRKKKQTDYNLDKVNHFLSEQNGNSGDEFMASKSSKINDMCFTVRDSDNGQIVSQTDCVPRTNTVIQNNTNDALKKNNMLWHSDNRKDSILDSRSAVYKDCGMTNEDISNISYSSSKENVQGQKRPCRQKLPKTKRQHYHIVKHINKIKNTFPPCFVVVEKMDSLNFLNTTKCFNVTENILPLSVRVKRLTDLCDKGTLLCTKNKKITSIEELMYKNIFSGNHYLGISDDDFEKPRVRSLRKRDKNISYAEPSEDDIMVEFSRKHSRGKNADCQFGKSGDESSSDNKKRKKQDLSKKNNSSAPLFGGNSNKMSGFDQNGADRERDKRFMENDGQQRNIFAYPPSSLSNALYYNRPDGSGMLPLNVAEKPHHMLYPQDPGSNISMMPAPSHISILANSSIPGAFSHHPGPVSMFPSLPPSFQGLPPQSFIGATPAACQIPVSAGAQGPNQFYIVRMNGKDVIFRFVPSPCIGAPIPMVLPKGKTLYTPPGPGHMVSQPAGQPHPGPICTQAMLRPVSSVAPAAHSNSASASSLQSLYGIPMLNRSGHSSSHSTSMSAIPVVPPAHLGYGSTIGMRPISCLTSGTHASHGLAASLSTPSPAHLSASPAHLSGVPSHLSAASGRLSAASGRLSASPGHLSAVPSHLSAVSSHLSAVPSHFSAVPSHLSAVQSHLSVGSSHLTGHVSTTGMRPISLASGTYASHSSAISSHISTTGMRPISLAPGAYASHILPASLPAPAHLSTAPAHLSTAPTHLTSAPSHLPSHVSTTGMKQMALTAPVTSHSSVTGLYANVYSSATTAAAKSVASSISTAQSTPPIASLSSQNTTTLVRSVQPQGSSLQDTSSNQSPTVRIFVPGCSAMGTPGHFATLGSLVNNSPLTRLSANSSLLPQCNRGSDPDLSPEQRAAKRRKLEKKYPLPPGVVIKTEPLDSPPKPTPTITSRSLLSSNLQLLSSNLQLLSASRPGSGVQRFRIMSPSLATSLSLRNIRGSSDIVYRTASVGGGQTVLVPSSLGLLSTATTPTLPSLTISSVSSPSASPGAIAYAEKTNAASPRLLSSLGTGSTLLSTETLASSHQVPLDSSCLLSLQSEVPDTISDPESFVAQDSSETSLEPAITMNGSPSSMKAASFELSTSSNVSTNSWSNSDTQLPPSKAPPAAACQDNAKASLLELQKIIQAQESRGLQRERLDKLKDLLQRKEQYYNELQRLADMKAPPAEDFPASQTLFYNNADRATVDSDCVNGTSETNPFVID